MSASRLVPAAVLALAALAAAWAGALPTPLAALALGTTFLVTPGLVLARVLLPHASAETRACAALALAPFVAGAPLALLVASGLAVAPAARAVALAIAAAAALLALPAFDRGRSADRLTRVAWIAAASWTLLVGALLVGNRFLPPRADGWFHAAVVLQVLQRGVPPEDPYFAGLPLLYFWGIHVWAAAWLALAPKLAVWTPLVAFNLASAAAVMLGVSGLARRLGAGPRGIVFTALVTTLGYSPFTWLVPVAHSLVGDVRGWDEWVRLCGHGATAVLELLAAGQLHASMAFFGDKYLVLTAFGMGLAFLPLALECVLDLFERPGVRTGLAYAAVLAAALFIHTVVGDVIVLVTGAVWLASLPAAVRGEAGARRALAVIAAAVLAGAVVMLPYLRAINDGKRGDTHVGFLFANLVTLAVGGAFYAAPGFAWLAGRWRASREARVVAIASLVCLAFALLLRLTENNQSKFFNLMFVVLAPPAALGWLALESRLSAAQRLVPRVLLFAGAVPTVALACWSFAADRGQGGDGYHPPAAEVAEAVDWARAHTPADAAFCDLGGGRDVLTRAGRSVIWGGFAGERDFGYAPDAIAARRDLGGALVRGLDPGPAGAALLASFPRELIVMQRAGAPDSLSDQGRIAARPDRYTLMWHNAGVAFWSVRRP